MVCRWVQGGQPTFSKALVGIFMNEALRVISGRYSDAQIKNAQDIVGDLQDELMGKGAECEKLAKSCDVVFDLLSSAN
jgi:hypothetical protein